MKFGFATSRVGLKLQQLRKMPLFLAVSGSHANGLARPDSDIDIRGVYLDPTRQILSLHRGADTIEATEDVIDIQLYELGKLLGMLLKHNGNIVRLLLSPIVLYEDLDIPWRELARRFLTKKLRHYYRGYAQAQRKRAMSERGGRALVYTYREIFEGLAVMRLGEPIFNFRQLWKWVEDRGFYTNGLLYQYFDDFTKEVTDEGWRQFYREWEELCLLLDEETAHSGLPESYDGYRECNELLLKWRLGRGLEID